MFDFIESLRIKASHQRAWDIGNKFWMRQWLLDEARRATSNAREFKASYAAQCREMAFSYGSAPTLRALNPHWETEPRVPAGNPDGGRWTRLVGDVPTSDKLPEIPRERPKKAEQRSRALRDAVKIRKLWGAETLLPLIEKVPWLNEQLQIILSASDPPDTLEHLQALVSNPAPGYQNHHIVEQTPAENEGFPREMIDGADNLVRIPVLVHRDISGWYSANNPEFGGATPRDYLRGKTWEERRRIGLKALRDFGVLKP